MGEKNVNEKQISVIVPCYNASAFIPRCMTYLLKQTIGIENMEIILVDDASTDNGATLKLLYSYEKQYPDNIIVIASSENRRQGGARNLGCSMHQASIPLTVTRTTGTAKAP